MAKRRFPGIEMRARAICTVFQNINITNNQIVTILWLELLTLGMVSAYLPDSNAIKSGVAMGNAKVVGLVQEKPVKSAKPSNSGNRNQEARTADWVAAVAMIAEKNKTRTKESKKPLSEDVPAKDIDIVRARTLSSQI